MPELRIDPLSGDEVLFAPRRAERSADAGGPCPFCPGNEDQTPPTVAAFSAADGWTVRVFRNKFPAVEPPSGVHEVIVDGRSHAPDFTAESLRMYRDRFAYHQSGAEVDARYVILFKNAGRKSGASREHPHAQLIALQHVPQRAARVALALERYGAANGSCALCDEIAHLAPEYTVHVTPDYAAYTRADARFAGEYRVVPRAHAATFGECSDAQVTALFEILNPLVTGLRELYEDLSYNLIFESGTHWRLSLIARTSPLAGFELGTGMTINSGDPKESAARLRHKVHSHDSGSR